MKKFETFKNTHEMNSELKKSTDVNKKTGVRQQRHVLNYLSHTMKLTQVLLF